MSGGRDTALARLEADLHRLVPVSAAMGVRVLRLEASALELAAPLRLNHNHAGSGFAGSLYGLATLAGWAYLRHIIAEAGLDALLLLGEARVRYHHPCREDLHAATGLADAPRAAFLERLRATGRARVDLAIRLPAAGPPAATVEGRYFARPVPAGDIP